MLRNWKVLLFVLAVLVIAGSAYAFAAANTIAESAAGYAGVAVPGYDVTSIVYDLDGTDPTIVDAITFDIAPLSGTAAAVTVKIQTANAGSWTTCPVVAGSATCTFGALPVANVTALNIVASSSVDP